MIEAKQCWPCAARRADASASILDGHLAAACAEVRRVTVRGVKRLGVVFAVPYISKSEKRDVDERLGEWVSRVQNVRSDAYAWVFPKRVRRLVATDGYLYPGVVLLLRAV